MKRLCSLLVLTGFLVILTLTIAKAGDNPRANSRVVRGEVLMLTMELLVVKDGEGLSTLVPLGKETEMDRSIKVGDHVEVRLRGAGEAETVTKAAPQPSREPQPQAK